MSSQMSNVSATACSESCCSALSPNPKSCSVSLPIVLINQILTYIAELNGVIWFQLLDPKNEKQYARLNLVSPMLTTLYGSIAHKSCNYPAPITVGINGRYIEGTITCISWVPDYAAAVFGEEGEVREIFKSIEMIAYEDDGEPEYVVLNGIYSPDTDFELLDSELHVKNPHQYRVVGLPVISAAFQDRDIIDLEVETYDDDDEFEGFDDADFGDGGIGWDEPNNGGIGW
jgi:hypothetical protein